VGSEINLMANYPVSKRDVTGRLSRKTDEDQLIVRKFDKDFL
jgi:hypothetical protein